MRLFSCKKLVRESSHPTTLSGLSCSLSLRWIRWTPQLSGVRRFGQPTRKLTSLRMWTSWTGLDQRASYPLTQLWVLKPSLQVVLLTAHARLLWVLSSRMCCSEQIFLLLKYDQLIWVLSSRMGCSDWEGLSFLPSFWQPRSSPSRQID